MPGYSALDGFYKVKETIGSGGFSKVKLGVHVLTGDEVAIKIMDKNFLADDIPRIRMEIDAMRNLVHQNICRLYQVIETDDKFFMILEYCTGGELFDYIVDNVRLIENEARRFFRQILSAVAYVHDQGFVHRDLKPENFLLDEEENLKLIDFGLCTQQKVEMDEVDICCGSPAYAAPELIEGKQGVGSEADMWSMGVLLYTLLCGCLPFEDDDTSYLYKKIQAGKYDVPDFLSEESAGLIQKLLQIDTNDRATIEDLFEDSWVTKGCDEPVSYRSQWKNDDFLDDDCVLLLSEHHEKSVEETRQLLLEWNYDYLTATYLLLLNKKSKGKPLRIGNHTLESAKKNLFQNLEMVQSDSFCNPPNGTGTYGNIELELISPEEKPQLAVSSDENGCRKMMQSDRSSHDHLDSLCFLSLESQSQSQNNVDLGNKNVVSSTGNQLGSDSEIGANTDVDTDVVKADQAIADLKFDLSAEANGCCQGSCESQKWNNELGHDKEAFSNTSEDIGTSGSLVAAKSDDERSWSEGACKSTRCCWERKNGCTLLHSYTAMKHPAKHFHKYLKRKALRKSIRGLRQNVRHASLNRMEFPLFKQKTLFRRSCMKYLDLPRPPAGSSPTAQSQQKIFPSTPAMSAFLNSIKHSNSRSSMFAKNHLSRALSLSRSFDSQLNVLTKNDHWQKPTYTDLISGSVDAELHHLHLNMEASHSKLHKRSLLSNIEHSFNRLLRVMTPRQKTQQGSEPQRAITDLHNIHVTSHDCPQTLLNHLKTVLDEKSIPYKEIGYKLRSFLTDEHNKVQLSFDLEVVRLRQLPALGVQHRKLKGDSWYYKRLCESILTAARL